MSSVLYIQESYVETILLASLLSAIVSSVVFYFYSIKRFEKKFEELGVKRVDWDFCGVRMFWYAAILIFKNKKIGDHNHPFAPVSATREIATTVDKILALWLWFSSLAIVLITLFF